MSPLVSQVDRAGYQHNQNLSPTPYLMIVIQCMSPESGKCMDQAIYCHVPCVESLYKTDQFF